MGAKNLIEELVELSIKNEKTGLVLLDNMIADALNEERMATKAEIAEMKANVAAKNKQKLVLVNNF